MSKRKNKDFPMHVDRVWIDKKIGGHSGVYWFDSNDGIVVIDYIGGKSKILLLWYNTILLIKYLNRKIHKFSKGR